MRFPPVSREDLAELVDKSEQDRLAALYTLQIGRLFCSIGLLEQATVTQLSMFVSHTDEDTKHWRSEHDKLRKSTFGQLVSRMERHGIAGRSLTYLKKLNALRNNVVHGLFWDFPFPGDPDIDQAWLTSAIDHLERIQLHFRFAEVHLSNFLIRSGCLDFVDLGEGVRLVGPKGSWLFGDPEEIHAL